MSASSTSTAEKRGYMPERLSLTTLHLLSAFLEELIREEQLDHRAQVLLHRVSMPICQLAGSDPQMFCNPTHPARKIFDAIVRIAKLSGPLFGPGDMLFRTLMESIKTLRAQKYDGMACLERVNSDLQHIVKLAYMRAPIDLKQAPSRSGELAEAKITAALLVMRHATTFTPGNTLLYFTLTEWLELLVLAMMQFGREKSFLRELDRMTFMLFYLSCNTGSPRYRSLAKGLDEKIDALQKRLDGECMGQPVNMAELRRSLEKLLNSYR